VKIEKRNFSAASFSEISSSAMLVVEGLNSEGEFMGAPHFTSRR
jgi:hypothetical protein